MSIFNIVFIIYFSTLMIGLFFLLILKGYYHFEYLKEIYPDKLGKYSNIFETYTDRFYNEYAYLMMIPSFKRLRGKEKTIKTIKLADTINLMCRLIYIDLIVIAATIIITVTFLNKN